MQFRSLKMELIYNSIKTELNAVGEGDFSSVNFPKSTELILKECPELTVDKVFSFIELVGNALLEKQEEKVNLVATVPPSFSLRTKRIQNVAEEILKSAHKSILLTGYSISEFISDIIDLLIEKSQKGVLVKFFLNDIKNQPSVDKLLRYKSRFLQIYDYSNSNDKMAALHAKIILVDYEKTLISSANLSYHGMAGNIEMGTIIHSTKLGKEIDEFFQSLIFQKIFNKLV